MRRFFSLLKTIAGFLLPKRGEVFPILLSLFLIAAVVVPEFASINFGRRALGQMSPWLEFSPLLILGIAIAAALGTFSFHKLKKHIWFVIGLIAVLAFNLLLLYRGNLLWRPELNFNTPNQDNLSPIFGWLGCVIGILVAFAVTKLFFVLIQFVKAKFSFGEVSRQKLMIAIAVVLFLCLTVRNVLSENNLSLGAGIFSGPVYQVFEGIFVLLVLIAFPAWLISRIRGWLGLLVGCIVLGAIAGLSASFVNMMVQFFLVIYAVVFSTVVSLLSSRPTASEPTGNMQTDFQEARVSWRMWSVAATILAVFVSVVFWNLDGRALLFGGQDRIALARSLKKVSTQRGLLARFEIWNNGGWGSANPAYVVADLDFSNRPDVDCLSELGDPNNQYHFSFINLNPEIDTGYLRKLAKQGISVNQSSISSTQLSDLTNLSGYIGLGDLEIVEPVLEESLDNLGRVALTGVRPGETAKFLRSIDPEISEANISIYQDQKGKLNDEDWKQILESSQLIDIYVNEKPSDDIVKLAIEHDVPRKLHLSINETDDRFWDIVCDTQIKVSMGPPDTQAGVETLLDAIWGSRGKDWASWIFNETRNQSGKIEPLVFEPQSRWVFQRNEAGSPTGMLLPFAEIFIKRASEMVDLEILSLDARWLSSIGDVSEKEIPKAKDVSVLGNFSNLKRLDMPLGFWGVDYSFLGQLPKLEHLQFDVFADGSKNVVFGFKAANCPELKKLVLIGQPSKAMAIEIGKLPKLESLKVLDVNESLKSPAAVSQLQTTIGQTVKLTIVDAELDRPDVPESFKKHLKKVRSEIRKKYLGDED